MRSISNDQFNRMDGIRILKEALNSAVTIQSIDLDSQFSLRSEKGRRRISSRISIT